MPDRRGRDELPQVQAENRRLRSELLRAQEDLESCRDRLRYATGEIATLRKRIPSTVTQAAAPGTARAEDPLLRLFAAIR